MEVDFFALSAGDSGVQSDHLLAGSRIIRCNNGPEYISSAIQKWSQEMGSRLEYIQPGNLHQNNYVGRLNRTVRYE